MALPVPYLTHSPSVYKADGGYYVDAQTEEFMQATRLVAGLVGGPAVYYCGSVMVSEGHPILGNTMRVMGAACSAYHLWQYVSVKFAEDRYEYGARANPKPKATAKGRAKAAMLGMLGKALRNQKIIPIPEDAYTLDGD
jgi:hypothetical protein